MKKKLIITLNTLLTLALFAGSINAATGPLSIAEEVAEKSLVEAPETLAELVVKQAEEISTDELVEALDNAVAKIQSMADKNSAQQAQMIENLKARLKTAPLTTYDISSLAPSTILAILGALGLSSGFIAGYLIYKDNKGAQPAMQYDYKYLPQ